MHDTVPTLTLRADSTFGLIALAALRSSLVLSPVERAIADSKLAECSEWLSAKLRAVDSSSRVNKATN